MSKPLRHAISSAKNFGGQPEDYLEIHNFMDSSKGAVADNRHRALTHNSWFIQPDGPLERAFGVEMIVPRDENDIQFFLYQQDIERLHRQIAGIKMKQRAIGRVVAIRDIGEQHVLEDFQGRFIPTAGDYLNEMAFKMWMDNGNRSSPPSFEQLQGTPGYQSPPGMKAKGAGSD